MTTKPKRTRHRPGALVLELNENDRAKLEKLRDKRQRTTGANYTMVAVLRDLIRSAKV